MKSLTNNFLFNAYLKIFSPHIESQKFEELSLLKFVYPLLNIISLLTKLLKRKQFEDQNVLFEKMSNILYLIPISCFFNAFVEWMTSLQEVIGRKSNKSKQYSFQ